MKQGKFTCTIFLDVRRLLTLYGGMGYVTKCGKSETNITVIHWTESERSCHLIVHAVSQSNQTAYRKCPAARSSDSLCASTSCSGDTTKASRSVRILKSLLSSEFQPSCPRCTPPPFPICGLNSRPVESVSAVPQSEPNLSLWFWACVGWQVLWMELKQGHHCHSQLGKCFVDLHIETD